MARAYLRYLIAFYEEKEERKLRRRAIRNFSDPFELPEEEYLENFKISEEMVNYLCMELEGDLAPQTGQGLSVKIKVLTCLKILLEGSYQRGVGKDENVCIAQTTVSKYVAQFTSAVKARLMPKWIQFPKNENSRRLVAEKFENKFGLPDVLGAIDCTHIKNFPPPRPTQAQFINRHLDTSLNIQLVADVDCRILHVNANYPGRVHDQFIFNYSNIKTEMRRLFDHRMGQYYLLGDSGYSLEPWLMTPIRDAAHGSPEERYTNWHCSARNVIERTNGYLKGTFRCLGIDRRLHYEPKKASDIIYACCTLYNIMKHFRIPMEEVLLLNDEEDIMNEVAYQPPIQIYGAGLNRRQNIIDRYLLKVPIFKIMFSIFLNKFL